MKNTTRTRTSARILAGSIAALLAVQLAAPAVRAVDVTWDITPGTVGAGDSLITGGAGTWDPANVANGNWTTDAGVNNVAWNNAGNDTAVFGGVSGTVTLASGATVGGITFNDNAGYLITGSTITLGTAGTITANVNAQIDSLLNANSLALIFAGAGNMTVSNAIANGTTLTKSGAGTLTLTGTNAFTAATITGGTITGGTITLSAGATALTSSATSAVNSNVTITTAAATITSSTAANTLTLGGTLNAGGLALTFAGAGNTTVTNAIASGTTLTKNGAGTLTLSGANTYTGATLVNAGTLVVNGGTIAGPGLIDIGANAATPAHFTLTSGNVTAGSQFVIGAHGSTGTAAINGGALQVNGTIYIGGYGEGTGTGTITQTAGTVTSTVAVNFGGGGPNHGIYNLSGGMLTTPSLVRGGSGTATFNFNGGTLKPSASTTTFLQGMTTSNAQAGGAIIDTNTFNITIAQPLLHAAGLGATADGGLTKTGSGILTLAGASTFTGNVSVNQGTLTVTVAANTNTPTATGLGNMMTVGKTVTVAASAKVIINANDALGGYQYKTPVVFLANGGTIENGLNNFTSIGDITLMNGGRINTLAGVNSDFQVFNLRGSITVSGTSGSSITTSGGTNNGVQLAGTTIGATTFNVGATGDPVADLTVSAPLVNEALNTGALIKTGAGKMVLSATNSYTGLTRIDNGILALGHATNTLANGGAVNVNGGTLALGTNTDTVGAVTLTSGSITGTGAGALTGTSYAVQSGSVGAILAGGGIALTKTTGGTVTLTGVNTYTGLTTISAGKLTIASTGRINTTSAVSIGAGEFNYNSATAMSQGVSFSTTGGTLSGTGTITPAVNVTAGNTLSPGNSIGTLSFGNGLTIGGIYAAQLGTPNASAAAGLSDRGAVTGALTLTSGTLTLSDNAGANSQGSAAAGAYRLLTFTGARTGTFASVTNPLSATLHELVVYNGASNGTVDLSLYRFGAANTIGTPVNLGNVRVGGTFGTSALSIQNTAATDTFSEGLNASGGTPTGAASTSGSISNLAAGATDSASLSVGLGGNANTGTAGAKAGTVPVNLASNGSGTSGYGATTLTAQTVTVNGGVYDLANANYTGGALAFGNVRVGASVSSQTVAFGNQTVTSASYQDLLDVSATTGNASVTATGFTGLGASASGATTNNLSIGVNTATAGSLGSTASLTLTSNANGVSGLSNGTATVVGSPAALTTTGGVYDLAAANYTGVTLAFGIVHMGASVSSQSVAFGNQTVTSASFQDLLDVSASTGNAKVTATGFTGLAASTSGATTSNLTFSVNTATAGSLASTASLTLTSNANGVAGLSNGTATTVGGGTIATTGGVYSGNMIWNGSSGGTWNTGGNWTDSVAGGAQNAPGMDAGFTGPTNADTATFGSTAGSVAVNLSGATPKLNAVTFDGTGDYTVAGASALTLEGTGASITASGGTQVISVPVTLGSNVAVSVTSGTLNVNGAVSGGFDIAKGGGGTLNFGLAGSLAGVGNLTASAGTTNVNSVLGTGSSAVSVGPVTAATLKFGSVSQTLGSLTIGAGSTVTFTSGLASFSGGGGKAPGFGGGGAVVPEPGTLGLLLVGALGVLNRRRRQA